MPPVGKSGPGMNLHQFFNGHIIVNARRNVRSGKFNAASQLAQVVGRDIGGHAHRDAG